MQSHKINIFSYIPPWTWQIAGALVTPAVCDHISRATSWRIAVVNEGLCIRVGGSRTIRGFRWTTWPPCTGAALLKKDFRNLGSLSYGLLGPHGPEVLTLPSSRALPWLGHLTVGLEVTLTNWAPMVVPEVITPGLLVAETGRCSTNPKMARRTGKKSSQALDLMPERFFLLRGQGAKC